MNKRHKHYDCIVAWAEGEEVEWLDRSGQWNPFLKGYPPYDVTMTYRIKPKRVKKEGWVNVSPTSNPDFRAAFGVYATKEMAENFAKNYGKKGMVCVHIEWEEEEE
jgi:hypothetical protein